MPQGELFYNCWHTAYCMFERMWSKVAAGSVRHSPIMKSRQCLAAADGQGRRRGGAGCLAVQRRVAGGRLLRSAGRRAGDGDRSRFCDAGLPNLACLQ